MYFNSDGEEKCLVPPHIRVTVNYLGVIINSELSFRQNTTTLFDHVTTDSLTVMLSFSNRYKKFNFPSCSSTSDCADPCSWTLTSPCFYCLTMSLRICLKILLMTYKAFCGQRPEYTSDS